MSRLKAELSYNHLVVDSVLSLLCCGRRSCVFQLLLFFGWLLLRCTRVPKSVTLPALTPRERSVVNLFYPRPSSFYILGSLLAFPFQSLAYILLFFSCSTHLPPRRFFFKSASSLSCSLFFLFVCFAVLRFTLSCAQLLRLNANISRGTKTHKRLVMCSLFRWPPR